jgi:chemotaxis protein histidine kinase CheA
MARRNREINIFNIAFLDVITGAMGAFVLMVLLLAPYYTGAGVSTLKNQRAAQAAADRVRQTLQQAQQAQQSGKADDAKKSLAESQAALEDVRQQLAALKQQIDQLSSQNKRLSTLDNRQQTEINDAQARIQQLERQAAQQTTEALDQAAKNIAQADQAIKSGNLDELRRLLAQARANLNQARQQLAAFQQNLTRMQTALQQELQRNRSLAAQLQQAQRELTGAREQAQSMQQERDRANNNYAAEQAKAAAEKQTLAKSGPATSRVGMFEVIASPECGTIGFAGQYQIFYSNSYSGFDSKKEESDFELRGSPLTELAFPGTDFSKPHRYHAYYTLPIVDGATILVGFQAVSQPSAGCHLTVKYSETYPAEDHRHTALFWVTRDHDVAISDTHPVLIMAVPAAGKKNPWDLAASDVTKWKKSVGGDGAKDWISASSSVPQSSSPVSPSQAFRSIFNGPPTTQPPTTNETATPGQGKH